MRIKILLILVVSAAIPMAVFAASSTTTTTTTATAAPAPVKKSSFYYAAWLPFWQSQAGALDIALHLESLNEVSPFSYAVRSNGALRDDLKISSGTWDPWFSAVKELGTKVIPTIAWFDGDGIQALLSSSRKRQAEENMVAALVRSRNFDGIDVDFESMLPKTRPYFSLFIQGLAARLHPAKKMLTCTVVPRTPLASLYDVVPDNVVYAESYPVLDQYCDEVRVMAYDQGPIDLRLDETKGNGTLYAPVADPEWVKKVLGETLQYVRPEKVMLGVPTYGYEYQVSWNLGATTYERVRSFTFLDAMDRADMLGVQPMRNNANELSFTFASTTRLHVPPVLISTVASAQPLALQTPNPNASTTFFASFPDAQSVKDKIDLAKKYGLRGVVFFKADGQMDPAIWGELK